jgi:apolipoprotein N-acyltransferase
MSESPSKAVTVEPRAVTAPPFSLSGVLPWLIFAGVLLLAALYFVSVEQSATSLLSGTVVHEWLHDGRHLLGFPCH